MAHSRTEIHQNDVYKHESTTNFEINKEEIQVAIGKAVKLRALHAALLQGNSPANFTRYPSASPAPQSSAQDYPIFAPSYENEPLPGYQKMQLDPQTISECWEEYGLGDTNVDETILSVYQNANRSLRKGFPIEFANSEADKSPSPSQDQRSVTGSCSNNNLTFARPSRTLSSSSNMFNPAFPTSNESVHKKSNHHSPIQPQQKNWGLNLSRLFPKLKGKRHKYEDSPTRTDRFEEASQVSKDYGIVTSIEKLKRELMEANERRDSALLEASEMKSSLGELRQKLEYLETYCEELKNALRQAMIRTKDTQIPEKLGNLKSIEGENLMPVSEEVMEEGFLQVVAEARLSVKQFCKILMSLVGENDTHLNTLLQPYNLSLNSRYTKVVLYHLEAIINQYLYQDFENCVFQKNGSPKHLDPHQERQSQFSSFVALRNLSWNEVLQKGTKFYCEEFSKFCDQKMSCVVGTLNWTRPWPEQMLQAFFVAAKCIWLLHLLAFSFNPPLGILRVEENRSFDSHFMEDMLADKHRIQGSGRVKVMVMPGFYVQDRVLRCKVICRYKSLN